MYKGYALGACTRDMYQDDPQMNLVETCVRGIYHVTRGMNKCMYSGHVPGECIRVFIRAMH